ncbi:hypothetical protein AK812_SmicGene34261 [Symbiodinium microadriaticum]|uniref:Uncharacterized protein n=1 Tax=Symbiodinium microadriaticum TaxID=2951 RepID=A0A1Q9CPH4_SYMMI|nr:hypothetical protein AK812_SmicGene34261 [Symbiodinium microadriaticum]
MAAQCVRVQQYQQTPAVLLKAKRGCKRAVLGVAALLAGASARLCRDGPTAAAEPRILRRAEVKSDVNYLSLLTKGDLPKRIAIVILLLALARIGFYIPLYGFDVDATEEYFSRQQTTGGLGFVDQLFGGGLGRVSLFSLGSFDCFGAWPEGSQSVGAAGTKAMLRAEEVALPEKLPIKRQRKQFRAQHLLLFFEGPFYADSHYGVRAKLCESVVYVKQG